MTDYLGTMRTSCYSGIYGLPITRPWELPRLVIHPCYSSSKEVKEKGIDPKRFNLTAVAVFEDEAAADYYLHDLSAVLTFCQQQWVHVLIPLAAENLTEALNALPSRLDFPYARPRLESLFVEDSVNPDSKKSFIACCMEKLKDNGFDQRTNFRAAFFRNTETWRLNRNFVDLTYYLDFSALEILSRTTENDFRSPVAQVMVTHLRKLGFGVVQDDANKRYLAMQTYAHLRNALFHNGSFQTEIDENHVKVLLKLEDYEDYVKWLVPDVLLKMIGYDDNCINWNRWIDRNPYK